MQTPTNPHTLHVACIKLIDGIEGRDKKTAEVGLRDIIEQLGGSAETFSQCPNPAIYLLALALRQVTYNYGS